MTRYLIGLTGCVLLAGGALLANQGTLVRPWIGDVAADAVLAPTYAQPGTVFTPRGRWRNLGPDPATFVGVFRILDPETVEVYHEEVMTTSPVPQGGTVELRFPDDSLTIEGRYTAVCSTIAIGDPNPVNDVVRRTFRVSDGGSI